MPRDTIGEVSAVKPAETTSIRVVIVDDQPDYRTGLRMLLDCVSDIVVVGEAADGEEALDLVNRSRPDVVLLDLRMPRVDGIAACAALRAGHEQVRILVLTSSDDQTDLFEAIRAGAHGYLLKGAAIDEVAAGIRAVHSGHSLITPSMAAKLLAEFAQLSRPVTPPTPQPEGALAPLTERELAVLQLVSRGMGNREIAKELFIAENTVKNHVRNILEKWQMHSRFEATMYAIRQRLIAPPG